MGERDDSRLSPECRAGDSPTWLLLENGTHWVVPGNVGYDGSVAAKAKLLIASGYERLQLPSPVYTAVTKKIESLSGGEFTHSTQDKFGRIQKCDEALIARLPTIRIRIAEAVDLELQGRDYVSVRAGHDGECFSKLEQCIDKPDRICEIGLPFLNKVVAVFDNEFNRIGFCPARIPL